MKISVFFYYFGTVICGSTLSIHVSTFLDTIIEQAVYYGMPSHLADPRYPLVMSDIPPSVEEMIKTIHYFSSSPRNEAVTEDALWYAIDDITYKQSVIRNTYGFSGWEIKQMVKREKENRTGFAYQDHIFFHFVFFKEEYADPNTSNFANEFIYIAADSLAKRLTSLSYSTPVLDNVLKLSFAICIDELKEIRKERPSFMDSLRDHVLSASKFVTHKILVERASSGFCTFTVAPPGTNPQGIFAPLRSLSDRVNRCGCTIIDRYYKIFSKDPWKPKTKKTFIDRPSNNSDSQHDEVEKEIQGVTLSKTIQRFLIAKIGPSVDLKDYKVTDDDAYSLITGNGLTKRIEKSTATREQKIADCNKAYNNGPECSKKLQDRLLYFMIDYRKEHKELFADWVLLLSDEKLSKSKKKVFIEALHLRYLILLIFKNFMTLTCNYCNILNKEPYLFSYEINFENLEIRKDAVEKEDPLELFTFSPISLKQLLINQLSSISTLASIVM